MQHSEFFKVIQVPVEGRNIENYTALTRMQKTVADGTYDECMDFFNNELELSKKAGAEIIMKGNDRAFFINNQNEPYKVLDVVPA